MVVRILRDTASAQSLLLGDALPEGVVAVEEEGGLLGGYPDSVVACPLMVINLDTSLVKGQVKIAITKT